MDDFEKKWQRIQDQLRIQMNGDEQPRFSSGRTLFGIRSSVEEKMDRFAREIEEESRRRRLAHEETEYYTHSDDSSGSAPDFPEITRM